MTGGYKENMVLLLPYILSAASLPDFEIAPGVKMPALNLGHTDDGSGDKSSVELWIGLGGRGIDTAYDCLCS